MLTVNSGGSVMTTGTPAVNQNALVVGNGAGGTGTLTVNNGGLVAIIDNFLGVVGNNGGTGTLTVNNGGSVTGLTNVGAGGGTGTLNVNSGGSVSFNNPVVQNNVGEVSSTGTVNVEGPGARLTAFASFVLGPGGTGTINITNGGEASSDGPGNFIIGDGPGPQQAPQGIGTALVSGTGSLIVWASQVTVGQTGIGTLTVQNGGTVSSPAGIFVSEQGFQSGGQQIPAQGTVNIGAPANQTPAVPGTLETPEVVLDDGIIPGGLPPAFTSAGTLNFNHTSSDYMFTPNITFDPPHANIGVVNVIAGSTIFIDNSATIGSLNVGGPYTPPAILTLSGATVAASSVTVGATAGGTAAALDIHGPGTLNINAGGRVDLVPGASSADTLVVGTNGDTGTVNINSGGSLMSTSTGSPIIGGVGSMGTVNVSGGTFIQSGPGVGASITLGSGLGTGTLNITNGGVVEAPTIIIGDAGGTPSPGDRGAGTVLVSGTGSSLTAMTDTPDSVQVGQSGIGILTVQNGGVVNASGADSGITVSRAGGFQQPLTAEGTINIGAPMGEAPVPPGFLNTPAVKLDDGFFTPAMGSPGVLNFNHTSTDYVFTPMITFSPNTTARPKDDANIGVVNVIAGTTIFTAGGTPGGNDYGGPTTIFGPTSVNPTGATLAAGGVDAFSANSHTVVENGGTLDLRGFNQTLNNGLENGGTVLTGGKPSPTTPGTTLTVANNSPVVSGNTGAGNNYVGTGGTLALNTFVNAGGPLTNQFTDRLLVGSNASGTTTVHVTNVGGSGAAATGVPDAATGISLIQVAGTSTPGAFTLPGGAANLDTPFVYHLNAYGPGSPNGPADPSQADPNLPSDPLTWDFRLQSAYETPSGQVEPEPEGDPLPPDARREVDPQVPAYLSAARGLFQAGLLDIGTLHQRLGEIRDDQTLDRQGMGEVFVRGYGGLFNYTTNRSFTDNGFNFNEDYAAVQFGGNYNAINNEYGTLRVGLAGAIGRMWLQPSAIDGMSKALFNTQNFFGTVTWQDRTGWYVDGIIMGGLFDGRFTTPQSGQTTGMNGTSVGTSVETGFPFPLPYQLSFEPQAQLVWQHLNFQNRTDVDGVDVDLGSPDQVTARVGFRLKRPFQTDGGMLFTPYLKANVLQGIGSSGNVVLSGVSFGTGNVGTALQVGGGVTGTLTRNLSLYGDVAWQSDVGNGGGFRGWVFNGGLRYLFGQPPASAPALMPAVTAAPAPQAARSYLVFFDWDKATLTGRARQIIREAAESSTRVQYTRIEVNGHTDTSGTPQYNMNLSLRRAHAVAGELVRDGVPASAISVRGFGQTDLLVPTGPGVREPQNRRVEIIIR